MENSTTLAPVDKAAKLLKDQGNGDLYNYPQIHPRKTLLYPPCLESSHQRSPLSLEQLPDVTLGKIISYLHWKEKEWFLKAVPSIERVVNSPLAWEYFENDRGYAVEKLYVNIYFPTLMEHELAVIKKYGKYFQSCTIWIQNFMAIGEDSDNDFLLLRAVSQNCGQLKSLCIMHPVDISVSKLKACFQFYMKPLQEFVFKAKGCFRLSLNRLFYSSIDTVETGISNYLSYLQENKLMAHVVCLDFSHGLVLDSRSFQSISDLQSYVNLHTLKCPIQSLNTPIVESLRKRKLRNLYLVNDDHTKDSNFFERLLLDWNKIATDMPTEERNAFSVHFIIKNRIFSHEDMNPNPFLKSLIFDNLSSNISASLMHRIADLYGQTLINLAFCSNYWEFLMHFADLGRIDESFRYLGRKCIKLNTFLSCLSLPSSALMSLARNSCHLSTVKVYKENVRLATVDKPEGLFKHKMALELGTEKWELVRKGDNIFNIPNADCRFLFGNCINEF